MIDRFLARPTGWMPTLLTALALGGCAAATPGYSPVPQKAPPPDTSGTFDKTSATYTLSAAERELDCRRLTGRMQVRILQIRGGAKPETSEVARTLQSTTKSVIGGTSYGTDPKGQRAYDRAQLEAYNAELARKNCPTFDLEAELASNDVKRTPQPVRKP